MVLKNHMHHMNMRAAASLQLPHLQISSALHSGQLNLTFLSPGMMCLLHPLHTGSVILEDIFKSTLLGIYTFLEILGFILNKSLDFSSNQCLHCIEGTLHSK